MRKKLFTVFEVLVWMVLFLIPMFFISTLLNPDLDIQKHYYAEFRDVNGIIIGSPVNYIGFNIGHVNHIQLLPDRIKVDIAITKKDYSLPRCSIIKVEESGIGGSRSLEIFPCENPLMANGIHTQKPKRVTDMLDDACTFVKSLTQSMGDVLYILQVNLDGGECCRFQDLKRQSAASVIELKQTSAKLDEISGKAPQSIAKTKNNIQKTLNVVEKVQINPEKIKSATIKNQKNLDNINKKLSEHTAADYRQKAEKLYWKTEVINVIDKEQLYQDMTKINNTLQSTQKIMNKIECSVQSNSLNKAREKVKEIKDGTENLINKD